MFRIDTAALSFNSDEDHGNKSYYAHLGNAAHLMSLVSTCIFCGLVASSLSSTAKSSSTIFDKAWQEQGFCIAHPDEAFRTSHDVCLYVDTAASVFLAAVYWLLKDTEGLQAVNPLMVAAIPGILGHGIGHGALAAAARSGMASFTAEGSNSTTTSAAGYTTISMDVLKDVAETQGIGMAVVSLLPLVVFWLTLIKASMPNIAAKWVVLTAAAAEVGLLFVPGNFGFTYVQTVLMLAFSLNQLARPAKEKDFSYAAYAVILSVPVTVMGWLESTLCSVFVKDWLYGHVLYDAYIPAALLAWYLSCYWVAIKTTAVSKVGKEKKTL